jgi:hypothetical protein
MRTQATPRTPAARQSGTAAVEFALIGSIMLLVLFGSLMYWRIVQAQQSVARATGDGARLIQHLVHGGLPGFNPARPSEQASILQAATGVVNQSLASSGIPPSFSPPQVQITWTSTDATLQVVYLLPPLLDNGLQLGSLHLAEPTRLQVQSLVKLPPSS